MTSLFRKLGWLFRRRNREQDLQDELKFHLEETAAEHRSAGEPPQIAEIAARRELGNLSLVKEDTRIQWSWRWLENFRQDFRYALRGMRRNPLFTMLAALSLALGVGANTAIYSFLDALLLHSLPVAEPGGLAVLNWHNSVDHDTVFHGGSGAVYDDAKYGSSSRIFPYPAFETLQKSQTVFSALFAYYPARDATLLIANQAETSAGQYVSGDYFRGLELAPAAGRLITPDDDRQGAQPVIVLSFGFGQAHFGSASAAIGQTILVNNIAFTVCGVAPPEFDGVDPAIDAKFFIPVHTNVLVDPNRFARRGGSRYLHPNDYWIELMGRLRPGISHTQAESEIAGLFHTWVETTATTDAERQHLPVLYLTDGATGIDTLRRTYSRPLYVLFGMVGLILAIACANIANLLLSRAAFRTREMAIRLGIGAGRGRVVRQLLTESIALSLLGGVLGIVFALGGIRFLTILLAGGAQGAPLHAELNWHVLAVAAVLSLATGLLFGLAPALQAARVDVMPVIRGDRDGRRPRWRFLRVSLSQGLVVSQIALSTLLLLGSGWFVRTLRNLQSVDLGFQGQHVLLFKVNARQAGHRPPEITSFYRDLQLRLAGIPGVRAATISNSPLVGEGTWMDPVVPLGKPAPERPPSGHGDFGSTLVTHILTVGPQFFTAMQIPLLAGREFDERDRSGSLPVAIVNETWAKTNLPGENPLGQHLVLDPGGRRQDLEIVGLAKDARYGDLKGVFPAVVYLAFWQDLYAYPPEQATYALRAAGDPLALARAAREIVRQADARIPVTAVETQAAAVDQTMTAQKLFARLCTGFALLALLIACVGLYATTAYAVARRTSEIGLRMALGAARFQVMWMTMRQVGALAAIGLLIGIPAALALSRLAASLLYGVKPGDAISLGIAIGGIVGAVGLAAYLPARRASRIDPAAALRHD